MVSIDQIAKIKQRRIGKLQPAKTKKPPKWHPPSSQERDYTRVLFSLTNELKNLVKEIIQKEDPENIFTKIAPSLTHWMNDLMTAVKDPSDFLLITDLFLKIYHSSHILAKAISTEEQLFQSYENFCDRYV